MKDVKEFIGEDYVHSANSLFHFMSEKKYLTDALKRKALCPRYCNEDVAYLNIHHDGIDYKEVAVLQKCFCDIPLQNIIKLFPVHLTENNKLTETQMKKIPTECSHPDLYGGYALAFSKKWGEENKLQPIHYLSQKADCASQFSVMLNDVLEEENLSDSIADALLNWMCYFKPLRGTMWPKLIMNDGGRIKCEIFKNFHDEHEWRFVPVDTVIDGNPLDCLIANGAIGSGFLPKISDSIEEERFKDTWLPFEYDDIRYIIVPNKAGRLEVIEAIQGLPDELFSEDLSIQKAILISKILILDDIIKDF